MTTGREGVEFSPERFALIRVIRIKPSVAVPSNSFLQCLSQSVTY
jgi:hypothetical protein